MFRFVGVLALVGGVLADPTKTMFGDDRTQDSFGRSQLEPPCSKIECILCANGGAMTCDAPFELKMDGTCCGYCTAPDHIVAIDRHVSFDSPHKTEQCESAPAHCRGPGPAAQCFTQPCKANEAASCGPTDCCAKCTRTS